MTAGAVVEPTTLRLKVVDSTKARSRPTACCCFWIGIPAFSCLYLLSWVVLDLVGDSLYWKTVGGFDFGCVIYDWV